jgi:hypothetical protein
LERHVLPPVSGALRSHIRSKQKAGLCRLRESGGALDYALASIELAEIFFLEGRPVKVRALAGEMFPLFKGVKS